MFGIILVSFKFFDSIDISFAWMPRIDMNIVNLTTVCRKLKDKLPPNRANAKQQVLKMTRIVALSPLHYSCQINHDFISKSHLH